MKNATLMTINATVTTGKRSVGMLSLSGSIRGAAKPSLRPRPPRRSAPAEVVEQPARRLLQHQLARQHRVREDDRRVGEPAVRRSGWVVAYEDRDHPGRRSPAERRRRRDPR